MLEELQKEKQKLLLREARRKQKQLCQYSPPSSPSSSRRPSLSSSFVAVDNNKKSTKQQTRKQEKKKDVGKGRAVAKKAVSRPTDKNKKNNRKRLPAAKKIDEEEEDDEEEDPLLIVDDDDETKDPAETQVTEEEETEQVEDADKEEDSEEESEAEEVLNFESEDEDGEDEEDGEESGSYEEVDSPTEEKEQEGHIFQKLLRRQNNNQNSSKQRNRMAPALLHRTSEMEVLLSFCKSRCCSHREATTKEEETKRGFMYVNGPAGSGKSLCLLHLYQRMERWLKKQMEKGDKRKKNVGVMIFVEGSRVGKASQLCSMIAKASRSSLSSLSSAPASRKRRDKREPIHTILILDHYEMVAALPGFSGVIKQLLEMTRTGLVSIVAAGNPPLHKHSALAHGNVHSLPFKAYDDLTIVNSILQHHILKATPPRQQLCQLDFEEEALKICATYVVEHCNGNLSFALGLCLASLSSSRNTQPPSAPALEKDGMHVEAKRMEEVIEQHKAVEMVSTATLTTNAQRKNGTNTISRRSIQSLDFYNQLLLVCAVQLTRLKDGLPFARSELFNMYSELSREQEWVVPSFFGCLVTSLVDRGFLLLEKEEQDDEVAERGGRGERMQVAPRFLLSDSPLWLALVKPSLYPLVSS
ncbi:NUP214 domain-containing protein [Balamuthia mandrillaris]